jgi:hypothetical protein
MSEIESGGSASDEERAEAIPSRLGSQAEAEK